MNPPPRTPTRPATVRLILRLATAAVGRAPWSAITGFLVVALGVVVLLAGATMQPTAQDRGVLGKDRVPAQFASTGAPGLLINSSRGFFHGEPITAYRVLDVSAGTVIPPGLDRVPAPGEVVVSPAMRALRADPVTTLADRYPGRDAGTVERAGLLGPRELVVWVGVRRQQLAPDTDTRTVTGFGGAGVGDIANVPPELRLAVPLTLIGFLLPLLALFGSVATAGTAARERRLAALRLLGMGARQCRLIAAVEAALVIAPGVVLGAGIFAVAAPRLAPLLPVPGGVWPDQVHLSLPTTLGALVGLPLAGGAATWWTLRRVQLSPLGLVQGAGTRTMSRGRLLPLAAGCAALIGSATASNYDATRLAGGLLLAAAALLLVGLVLAAPLLCRLAATAAGRVLPGLAAQLATARVRRDATTAARLVTGSALVVFVSGLLLSFFPLLQSGNADGLRALRTTVGPEVLVADVQRLDHTELARLNTDPDVAGTARLTQIDISDGTHQGVIAAVDCARLSTVIPDLPGCTTAGLLLAPTSSDPKAAVLDTTGPLHAVTFTQAADGTLAPVNLGPITITGTPQTVAALASLTPVTGGVLGLLDQRALPPAARPGNTGGTILVRPAAGGDTERLRTLLTRATGASTALTVGERVAEAERDTQVYRDITLAALASAALVGLLTLTSTLIQQVREHRRSLIALWMTGTPKRTVRSATLLQSALVILPVTLLSLLLGLATAAVFLALDDGGITRLPWPAISIVAAGAAVLPLLATALTLPALRTTAHPQLLPD